MLRDKFAGDVPYAVSDITLFIEHGFVDMEAMPKAIVTLIYTTPELHKNFMWFWDPVKKVHKENHFEWSTFYDGFPLFGGKSQATAFSLRALNLPGLIHRPDFQYILFIAECKENDPQVLKLLQHFSKTVTPKLTKGFTVEFRGYPEHYTVPKSNISLNGTHKITFGKRLLYGADAKAAFASQGCDSANQRYLPFFDIPTEAACNSDIPFTLKNYVPF